jgi:hypothetical protein
VWNRRIAQLEQGVGLVIVVDMRQDLEVGVGSSLCMERGCSLWLHMKVRSVCERGLFAWQTVVLPILVEPPPDILA